MICVSRQSVGDIPAGSEPTPGLERRLTGLNLLLLGIGAVIGAGIFVMTGTAAAHSAGPAIALSFVIAAIACLCARLCYAELASMFPVAGSAYSYTRAALYLARTGPRYRFPSRGNDNAGGRQWDDR